MIFTRADLYAATTSIGDAEFAIEHVSRTLSDQPARQRLGRAIGLLRTAREEVRLAMAAVPHAAGIVVEETSLEELVAQAEAAIGTVPRSC